MSSEKNHGFPTEILRLRMFFGLSIPDGRIVSEEEWMAFQQEKIAGTFDNFNVVESVGYYLGDPERSKIVRELIQQLPEKQRKIIWADALSRSGNIPADDLARELDIPPGTVRVYRKRALDKLRALLTEHGLAPETSPQS